MEFIVFTKEQFEELVDSISAKIFKCINNSDKSPLQEEVFTTKEFITYCKISLRTAQKLRDELKIPYSRVGRKILYKKSDVDAFLKSNLICTTNKIDKRKS